jgi:hypothetical protein
MLCALVWLLGAAHVPTSGAQMGLNARLGITFISSWDHPASEGRYQAALALGAGWNRWPLYWDRVELGDGTYNWAGYDRLVVDDVRHGLRINAILLGRPSFRANGNTITNLYEPVFANGTDDGGGAINPRNYWAMFVYQAVARYKPNGVLAQQQRWADGMGVRVWEMWNEPDLGLFWNGGVRDYVRLLKVGYIAAHAADSAAQVMYGGLAYGNPDEYDWLRESLALIEADPARGRYNWYFDLIGLHNYSYAKRTGLVVERMRRTLTAYGLNRPIWLNESGAPVWDDYPGPTFAAGNPAQRTLRVTQNQAAWFFIQSTALAWAEGADVVFFHQLYDDCGNQAGGTDFAPNSGGAGDAFGLYRNLSNNGCYTQHPQAGTPRPSAAAFRLMAQAFAAPFEDGRVRSLQGGITAVSFERPASAQRIYVLWNRTAAQSTARIPAGPGPAELYTLNSSATLYATGGQSYEIILPPAVADDYPYLPEDEFSGVGGQPYILIMPAPPEENSTPIPTPTALSLTAVPLIAPTIDPTFDDVPPTAQVLPLPATSPATFTVAWQGADNSGVDRYLVWVRVDGGAWQPWLETAQTSAEYSGIAGQRYEFAVWAVDLGGNWSGSSNITPQASTAVG